MLMSAETKGAPAIWTSISIADNLGKAVTLILRKNGISTRMWDLTGLVHR